MSSSWLRGHGRQVFWCAIGAAIVVEGGVLAARLRPGPEATASAAAGDVRGTIAVQKQRPAQAVAPVTVPAMTPSVVIAPPTVLAIAQQPAEKAATPPAKPRKAPVTGVLSSFAGLARAAAPAQPIVEKVLDAAAPTVAPPANVVEYGREIFLREWTPKLAGIGEADGLGPLYNDTSCMGCHNQGGAGGGGPNDKNVILRTFAAETGVKSEMVHHFGTSHKHVLWRAEMLNLSGMGQKPFEQASRFVDAAHVNMTPTPASRGRLSQRNATALFGAGLIDSIPDEVLIEAEQASKKLLGNPLNGARVVNGNLTGGELRGGRLVRFKDGRLGRFGWKAQTATLDDFTRGACANELGLTVPGHVQPRPSYAAKLQPDVLAERLPVNDLSQEGCNALVAYLAQLPTPKQRLPRTTSERAIVERGETRFASIGCTDCHRAVLGNVEGIYSDLLLHDMGPALADEAQYYGGPTTPNTPGDPSIASTREWKTPPLWGVRDSGPYLHDGRAATLEKAIALHGGQGARSTKEFFALDEDQRFEVIAFLKSLVAPD